MSGPVFLVSEREPDVVVPQCIAGGVGEVAVVLYTRGLQSLEWRGGTITSRPGVEFITPCAVPGSRKSTLDGFFEAVTCVESTWSR